MPDLPHWTVTLDGTRPLKAVQADLVRAGLKKPHALTEIQVIEGDAAKSKLSALRKVKGVSAVEGELDVGIGDPGDDTFY